MGVWIIMGALSAFGAVCAVWALFGWLSGGGKGTVICVGKGADGILLARRMNFFRRLGFFRGEVILLDLRLTEPERAEAEHGGIRIYRKLATGAKENGTERTGNFAGNRGNGGLPEL